MGGVQPINTFLDGRTRTPNGKYLSGLYGDSGIDGNEYSCRRWILAKLER